VKRSLFGAVALAAVALSVVFIGSAGAAKPPPTSSGGCPNGSLANYPTSGIVGATFATSGQTTTYKFTSQDQSPTNGVPGLVGYCVYVATAPKTVTTTVKGSDGSAWQASKPGTSFGFTRSGGESSNIPLDGKTVDPIGSATWANGVTVPTTQNFLLHISGAQCNGSPTCFVRPTLAFGPICNAGTGNTNAAYNDIPTDVTKNVCGPPSDAFEGNSTSEFGDVVGLTTTSGKPNLVSLRVDFQSYGCGTSGHWYDVNGDCTTTSGATFQIPPSGTDSPGIRANIYAVSSTPDGNGNPQAGQLIATTTANPNIPYRPSADNTNCTGALAGKWFDGTACRNSISYPVTFTNWTFPNGAHTFTNGDHVIWTVAFNTSDYGSNPINTNNQQLCNLSSDPGCGWDSLNVGTMTYYPGTTPFAGTEVDPASAFVNAASSLFYCHDDTPINVLRIDTVSGTAGDCTSPVYTGASPNQTKAWTGLKPLGQIVLGP
jgi:hypothetical protein